MSSPFQIHCGNALTVLRTLPDSSVDCCVTSPPYYRLRSYGSASDEIGQEESPEEYVSRLVDIFHEVRRVLTSRATCWINIGDSYAGSWGNQGRKAERGQQRPINGPILQNLAGYGDLATATHTGSWVNKHPSLKPKDLCLVPERLAIALQADGWWIRSRIIWRKTNSMPESTSDRPTRSHEHIWMLAKSEHYYYDGLAIAEPLDRPEEKHRKTPAKFGGALKAGGSGTRLSSGNEYRGTPTGTRNKRDVWSFAVATTPELHYATFPIDLAETCVVAACPENGTVIDPFSGAGTTGLACLRHGRKYLGVELYRENIDLSYARARKYYPLLMEGVA